MKAKFKKYDFCKVITDDNFQNSYKPKSEGIIRKGQRLVIEQVGHPKEWKGKKDVEYLVRFVPEDTETIRKLNKRGPYIHQSEIEFAEGLGRTLYE